MAFFQKLKDLTTSDKHKINKPAEPAAAVVVQAPAQVQTSTTEKKEKKEKKKDEDKGFFEKIAEANEEKKEEEKIIRAYQCIDAADVAGIKNIFSKQPPDPDGNGPEDRHHSLLLTASLKSIKGDDEALQQKYLDIMEVLVDAGANVRVSDENGFEAIHATSSHNATKLLQKLIDKGADVNSKFTITTDIKQMRNFTPLHWTCHQAKTYPEVIELLLKAKADPNLPASINEATGWTPLNISASQKDWKIVKLLIEKNANMNISAQNIIKTGEWNPLHFAINAEDKEMADYLISKGCPINSHGKNNETPLLIAASKGNWDLVHYLAEKKADLNIVLADDKKSKCTALHYAIMSGQCETVQKLIKMGADTEISGYWKKDDSYHQESFTTWEFALESKNKEVVKLLLAHGYKLPKSTNWIWDGIKAFKGFENEWAAIEANDSGNEITVKITAISGKNLAAKDVHVLKSSDPYVIVFATDPSKQGKDAYKKLWKSKYISRNLNPVWIDKPEKAETLPKVKSSRKLVFVLFDKDLTSKDDFLGSCTIHLAPLAYFGVTTFSTTLKFTEFNPLDNQKDEVSGTMDVTLQITY